MVVGERELIDTLWNVNHFHALNQYRMIYELIDTLWNVNLVPSVPILLIE